MARSKKKLKKKALYSILLFIIIIGGVLFSYNYFFKENKSNKNTTNINSTTSNDNKETKEDEVYKINLIATGDALIHNAVFWEYETADGGYNFDGALDYIRDIVSNYDIAYYNQETPFAGGEPDGYPQFSTPSEFGDAMIKAGFNMVSLATNHTMDKGENGVLNFYNYFKNKEGIVYSGIADSNESRNNFIIGEKNNITYAMLSYTTSTNGINVPNSKDYLVNIYSNEQAKKDIEALRDKVDVLIVAMHWGVEYATKPNESQIEIANYLADLDVDIVIGCHPHVLQPITQIDDTLVMYSLGNFISNQYGTDDYNKLVGFMATLDITKTVAADGQTTIDIDNLGGELIFTKYNGNPITTSNHDGHVVIPFSKMNDNRYLKDYKRIYEKYSDVLKSMGTQLNIVPLPEV